METLIFIAASIGVVGIFSLFSFIKDKKKEKDDKNKMFDYYKQNNQNQNEQIKKLQEVIENLRKENQDIKNCDNALMQEKYITNVFEALEENNHPRITKEKLTHLWEVIPYYPPDWKLRCYVVRKRDNYTCRKCGKDLDEGIDNDYGEVHHLIPLSQNGTNEIKNLVLVCHECHRKLHDELYNFDFSKYGYTPLYGMSYAKLFPRKLHGVNEYIKGNPHKLNEYLKMKEYQPEEPDTDIYYNISYWEDKLN